MKMNSVGQSFWGYNEHMAKLPLEEMMLHARKAVRSARGQLLDNFGNINAQNKNNRDVASSIVTEVDRRLEHFIKEQLTEAWPSVGFYGEETGRSGSTGTFWLVDPLDGTNYYVRGIPMCSSMISLIDQGQVVLSIIYDFINDDTYWAIRGGGAYRNDSPISVSNRPLKDSLVAFESSLAAVPLVDQLRDKVSLVSYRASGYESILVASGKLEAKICIKPFGADWDYAPGSLLVEEAGGVAVNIGQSSYNYQNHDFILSNKVVHDDLIRQGKL